jgi:ketosteroid isomerase-like protein
MMKSRLAAGCLISLVLAGCHRGLHRAKVSQDEAAKIDDATRAAWTSRNVSKIKAVYGPGFVGFAWATEPLVTNKADWDGWQQNFAVAKFDGMKQTSRMIQTLSHYVFIVSAESDITSSTRPDFNATLRCTDVYQRGEDDHWLVVNEHCSAPGYWRRPPIPL